MKIRTLSILLAVCLLASFAGCRGQRPGRDLSAGPDSLYAWENIRIHIMDRPEYALALVDTAEMRGLVSPNGANFMRAQIYGSSNDAFIDLEKACEYCLKVLENPDQAVDSVQAILTLNLLVSTEMEMPERRADAVRHAIEGAQRAHNAGRREDEADFYFYAGQAMEKIQRGSGKEYLDRSMNIYREASRNDIRILPTFSYSLGVLARMQAEREDHPETIRLLQERLQVIDRIDREYKTAPRGWTDQQRLNTYSVLAYSQYASGDKEAARRSAEAFERLPGSDQPLRQQDILVYYSASGNGRRVQEIYDRLDPLYRASADTISPDYSSLLSNYALGLENAGRYREAYLAQNRYIAIQDSLVQRERRQETLELAQRMRTQEKELQLKDEEAKTRVLRILFLAAVLLCLCIVWMLARARQYNKTLSEKNRRLLAEIEQREREEQQSREQLREEPEAELSSEQLLFRRLCELMEGPEPIYTEPDLDRGRLARLLGTNEHYISDAVSACTGGKGTGDFINGYRLRHAAHLLATTRDSAALIAELSGFSRSTFFRLFNDAYGMSPADYRKVVHK